MREYELLVLGKGDLAESEQKTLITEIEKTILDGKGTVEKRDDWGKRNLDYDIQTQKESVYSVFHYLATED